MKAQLVVAALAVAVGLPAGYNVAKGHQEQLRLIQKQIAQARTTRQTEGQITATMGQIERYRARLPSEPSPSWLVHEAVALGEQVGLQLTTIDQDPPQDQQAYTRLGITLEFSATYHQVGRFLDLIERSERFIRVERLEVSPSRTGENNRASVRLVLSTVYVPPAARVAG